MAVITNSWTVDIALVTVLLITALLYCFQSVCNYWKDRKVPFQKSSSAFIALYKQLSGKVANSDVVREVYQEFELERYYGVFQFTKPAIFIRDPKLVERILITDFSHFVDRGTPLDPENEPLTANLVNLKGNEWRHLRHKLMPTFSSGKLKGMFRQMSKCGENILQVVENYGKTGEAVEVKELAELFSIEVISSTAFGLQSSHDSAEGKQFKKMVDNVTAGGDFVIRFVVLLFFPKLAKFIGLRSIEPDVEDYFMSITKSTMEYRLKNNIKREDFFQHLLTLKQQDEIGKRAEWLDDGIEQDDVPLQYVDKEVSVDNNFTGTETVSTTISVVLYYVAEIPEVQKRLQEEVDSALPKHGGQWTYQALTDMTYLDQVIQEIQRMFPIAHVIGRVCTTPYKVPDSDLVIEKGTDVLIPTIGIHMDPEYYPDPAVLDPDRFEGNNFKQSALYMPFGDGPRMCIAMKFAILKMKVFISRVVSRYFLKSSSKPLSPLRFDPRAFNNKPLGGIWITVQPRT